ncbi:cupin domain-containing protein [Actinomadura logoneensis]|uniref:Cupin domain-containing protein n=1 Tax=Actinomadura logoneensis TaxID=2293572 RepID=A0A372JAE0_9ACTN|nr:cupin domain-containing protein [Actinomadura logoneensis]RFU36348.1 cupin domain-containing protein [Actinomadura logoneensis]
MIVKFTMALANAETEFGMACQRLVPWSGAAGEPPFGVMACYLPGGNTSAPDLHDQDEVMIMMSGAGSVRIGDESTAITVNDVIVVPRNREHVVSNLGDSTMSWISFYWPLHEPTDGGAR